MTNSSNVSDLDNIKPPSLMDNAMFSSTESFSYRQVAPIVIACDQVLIDNVKPPSLMEEISMSQSCASITSDISDMPLDSDANNERIARMASNCVQRINLMTYSADNSETDTLDRIFGSKNKTIKHKRSLISDIFMVHSTVYNTRARERTFSRRVRRGGKWRLKDRNVRLFS